jgi:hypothetical protein
VEIKTVKGRQAVKELAKSTIVLGVDIANYSTTDMWLDFKSAKGDYEILPTIGITVFNLIYFKGGHLAHIQLKIKLATTMVRIFVFELLDETTKEFCVGNRKWKQRPIKLCSGSLLGEERKRN